MNIMEEKDTIQIMKWVDLEGIMVVEDLPCSNICPNTMMVAAVVVNDTSKKISSLAQLQLDD